MLIELDGAGIEAPKRLIGACVFEEGADIEAEGRGIGTRGVELALFWVLVV